MNARQPTATPNWVRDAVYTQPWGDDGHENLYVKFPAQRIPVLKRFKINAIVLIPPAAHNDIYKRKYNDEQFARAIRAYQQAGIRVVVYTCLGHVGHDPSVHRLNKEHPDWLVRNADGQPAPAYFGDAWLCPHNNEAHAFVTAYTCNLVQRFSPDAILDDNEFMCGGCYCRSCRKKFADAVRNRFSAREIQARFHCRPNRVDIPRKRRSLLYEAWIDWRYQAMCARVQKLRARLQAVKPDIQLVTNSLWSYKSWENASEDQCAIADINLTEGYRSPIMLGSEVRLARAFSRGKKQAAIFLCTWRHPPTNEAVFEMQTPEVIKSSLAAVLAQGASPWLVNYAGWDLDETMPSSRAIRNYLNFYHDYRDYYRGAESYAGVAVCHSRETLDHAGDNDNPRRPYKMIFGPNLTFLAQLKIPFDLVHTKHLPAALLSQYKCILFPHSICIGDETLAAVSRYVRTGGVAVFTEEPGWYDGWGQKRFAPALESLLGKAWQTFKGTWLEKKIGGGRVIFSHRDWGMHYLSNECWSPVTRDLLDLLNGIPGARTIAVENCPASVEIHPTTQTVHGARRYVLHVIDTDPRCRVTDVGIVLRAEPGFRARKITLLAPDRRLPARLKFKQEGHRISFRIPELNIYQLIVVETRCRHVPGHEHREIRP